MAKKKEVPQDLNKFLTMMNNTFGGNTLVEFGEGVADVEALPTGIPSLDLKLGVGGVPRGRIIEVYGPESAGKTTLAIKIMANAQKLRGQMPKIIGQVPEGKEVKPISGRVGFIDVEHAFSPEVAKMQGLNMGEGSDFFFSQPTGGEQALQILEYMVCSNLFDVIVLDSVAGLVSIDEQDKKIGEKTLASTAQLMSAGLRKLVPLISVSKTVVIFINQIREKVAVMYGSNETTTGGRALKFYSSIRIRVARRENIQEGQEYVGHTLGIDIKKNKVAPPFQKTEVDLYYRDTEDKQAGFDIDSDLLEVAQATGIVQLKGSSYQYVDRSTGEIFKAVGKVKWKALINDNPDLKEAIERDMLEGGQGIEPSSNE